MSVSSQERAQQTLANGSDQEVCPAPAVALRILIAAFDLLTMQWPGTTVTRSVGAYATRVFIATENKTLAGYRDGRCPAVANTTSRPTTAPATPDCNVPPVTALPLSTGRQSGKN